MASRQESGRTGHSHLLNRLRQVPAELGRLAGKGYYMMATTETQRADAEELGEQFIRGVFPFLLQPEIYPALAFSPPEAAAFRNFADGLAEGAVTAREPDYLRHSWSSPGYRQDLAVRRGQSTTLLQYVWDTGLQLPVDMAFFGYDHEAGAAGKGSFVVLHDMADKLGLPYDSRFRAYQNGERIDSHDLVRINGTEQLMSDEYRYVGCMPGGKDGQVPYYIYMQIKRVLTPVKQSEPLPIPVTNWTTAI